VLWQKNILINIWLPSNLGKDPVIHGSASKTGWNKKAETIKEGYAKFGPKLRNMNKGNVDDLESILLNGSHQ